MGVEETQEVEEEGVHPREPALWTDLSDSTTVRLTGIETLNQDRPLLEYADFMQG